MFEGLKHKTTYFKGQEGITGRNENDTKNQKKQREQKFLQKLCDHSENIFSFLFFFHSGGAFGIAVTCGACFHAYYLLRLGSLCFLPWYFPAVS